MGDSEDQIAKLVIRVFDGTRKLIGPDLKIALTIDDGNLKRVEDHLSVKGPVHSFDVNFFDNFGDRYTVNVTARGYKDAGCRVKVSQTDPTNADVMLLPSNGTFKFPNGDWASLEQNQPELYNLLKHGAVDAQQAEDRYNTLMRDHAPVLAAVMNITEAMSQIDLANGTALDYFKELIWNDTMQQDRFFAYAYRTLIADVVTAAGEGRFAEEPDPGANHPGATLSYKQTEFEQGDVQLTFHENDFAPPIDDKPCVVVEPDIDYYRDLIAHGILEVLPNDIAKAVQSDIAKGLTDPKKVYVLRWIAGREAGEPEFDPPYVISA